MRGRRLLVACVVVAVAAIALLILAELGRDAVVEGTPAATSGGPQTVPVTRAEPPAGSGQPAPATLPPRLPPGTGSAASARAASGPDAEDPPAGAGDSDARTPDPVAQLPVYLDREIVRELMADRVALSAALQPVPGMTSEGYRMLRLERTEPGDLYGLLGLQAGDVLVMVNEQSVHEGENPLWDVLDREGEVRVWVMRQGGAARHFTYRFE